MYDAFEGERADLDHYESIVEEFDAHSVLDVGCGTGEFACRLARSGISVVAVDPASASLQIAQAKTGADDVMWIDGDATTLPRLAVDLAVMTGNVAQVFVGDDEWSATLRGIADALRPSGVLVFETRDPARRAWERWTTSTGARSRAIAPGGEWVETWCQVLDVEPTLVTFRQTTRFESDGEVISSDSTLRFRSRAELDASLAGAGFEVLDVRYAPDRPGHEWVYVARLAR
jgi:SAM-dependent methyltransferase